MQVGCGSVRRECGDNPWHRSSPKTLCRRWLWGGEGNLSVSSLPHSGPRMPASGTVSDLGFFFSKVTGSISTFCVVSLMNFDLLARFAVLLCFVSGLSLINHVAIQLTFH